MPPYTDPYMTLGKAGDASWNDQPPSVPPAGAKTDTVLQIYVPAENTLIDCGAGALPGIRMETDHHVHMTARGGKLTTLSLGDPGGPGIDGAAGINIITDGDKNETVVGKTSELYGGDAAISYNSRKSETVIGDWDETCQKKSEHLHGPWSIVCENAKDETVHGTVTQDYRSEQNVIVGKPSDFKYKSHKTEHVDGDLILGVDGRVVYTYGSDITTIKTGKTSDIAIDNHTSISTGHKIDAYVGYQISVNGKLAVSINETLSLSQNLASASIAGISVATTAVSVSATGISTSKVGLNLWSGELHTIK